MSIEDLSLKEIKKLGLSSFGHTGCILERILDRIRVDNYDGFVEELYKDIDAIIEIIQTNRELRQKNKEDRLTIEIINLLSQQGYDASHDKKTGGHVDITVESKGFTWLGEAKIYYSNTNLLEGLKQLCTRYTTGDVNQEHGGLLFYIFEENTHSVMGKWKEFLNQKKLPNYSSRECPNRPLSFFSEHTHNVSGKPFTIRHMPVMLHFNPQDKSGRKRQK